MFFARLYIFFPVCELYFLEKKGWKRSVPCRCRLEARGAAAGLVVAGLAQRVAEPFETLVQTVTGGGASGLDVPGALPQAVQTQLVSNLSRVHRVRQILLVGENQQKRISQLVLVQHALQLLAGLNDTVPVVAVDDEDDTLRVLEVVPPQRSDLVLSTNIPDRELDVLVL